MFRLWSEWDLGYGDTVFRSVERAIEVLADDENLKEVMESEEYTSVGEIISAGLMGFRPLTVID